MFLVATLPNLLFGPIAGALVDRWDHREVMIVSDLLRAGLVLLIPIAAVTNLALAYPLVFLVTTVSIFFRPAKGAILPRIVATDDLVPANSALWVGETFADIGGYVLAGLFVALLGQPAAARVLGRLGDVRRVGAADRLDRGGADDRVSTWSQMRAALRRQRRRVARRYGALRRRELREGWQFLRGDRCCSRTRSRRRSASSCSAIFLVLTPVYAAAVARPPRRSPTARRTRSSRARSARATWSAAS